MNLWRIDWPDGHKEVVEADSMFISGKLVSFYRKDAGATIRIVNLTYALQVAVVELSPAMDEGPARVNGEGIYWEKTPDGDTREIPLGEWIDRIGSPAMSNVQNDPTVSARDSEHPERESSTDTNT